MKSHTHLFCPRCGGNLTLRKREGKHLQICPDCGFVMYQNQNLTTSAVIVQDGKILLVRRAVDPHKGSLDLPGGFVEPTERPDDAMQRELLEELGVPTQIVKQLGVYGPDPYEYQGVTVYNGAAHFQVKLLNQNVCPADDVSSFEWHDLQSLDVSQVAFPSQRECLEKIRMGELTLD